MVLQPQDPRIKSGPLRTPRHSPPNPLSFSYVEEAIEAKLITFKHAKLKLLSVLSGIRIPALNGLLSPKPPLLLLRRRRH